MKYIKLILFLILFASCSELNQTIKRSAYETQNAIVANTVRKIQNKVERKVEKSIDNIGKKKPKETEKDSTVIK